MTRLTERRCSYLSRLGKPCEQRLYAENKTGRCNHHLVERERTAGQRRWNQIRGVGYQKREAVK